MSAEKRRRSVNFSIEEKRRFLRILQKRGNVILSKVNAHDLQTNRLKEDAWLEITNDLNATGSILRTTDNLKKLWQKMKSEAKVLKSLACDQSNGTDEGLFKKVHDPILELVAQMIESGTSGIEFVNVCDSEILNTNIPYEAPEPDIQSTVTQSSGLCNDIKPKTHLATEPIIIVEHLSASDDVTPFLEECKEKDAMEDAVPKSHLKRRWPTICNSERLKTTKFTLNNNLARESIKCEKDKRALIALQKQYMAEEHELKMRHADLKTKILEAVLKKIQDEKPVDSELLKLVSNL